MIEQRKEGREALMEAYLAKRENLLRLLAARLGSMAQAEDAIQGLFLKLAAIEPGAMFDNPEAMVYRMAANLAVDQLRRRRRAEMRDQAWAARRRLSALRTALDRLPPRMRQAFRLCKLEEQAREEAARRMGVSVKAIEKQIAVTLEALTWSAKPASPPNVGGAALGGVILIPTPLWI